MYKYFLALKYLVARPIHLLGTVGVCVAVWAMIVVVSVFSGFVVDVRTLMRGPLTDLVLVGNPLEDSYTEAVRPILDADPDLRAFAPRLYWFGLLHAEGRGERAKFFGVVAHGQQETNFVRVVGIDYEAELEVSDLGAWLAKVGDAARRVKDPKHPFVVPSDELYPHRDAQFAEEVPGMLVGLARAQPYGKGELRDNWLLRGDRVVVTSARRLAAGPEPNKVDVQALKKSFAVSGIFSSEHREFEQGTVLVDIEEMRSLFGHDVENEDSVDVFNEVAISLRPGSDPVAVAARLNARLADAGIAGRVESWEARRAGFLNAVEHERGLMKLVLIVLMVVASFLIFATLSMMVAEKTRDVGVLTALGATRRGVLGIFLATGTTISLLGTAVGEAAGYASCIWLNDVNDWVAREWPGYGLFPPDIYGRLKVPFVLDPLWFVEVAAGAVALSLLFSLVPAWRASRLDPVAALRYE